MEEKLKISYRYREQSCGCYSGWELGEGGIGSLGLANAN